MHRNTYVVVSILAVLAALIVGVNFGKKLSTPAPAVPVQTAAPTPTPLVTIQTYVNAPCGFTIQYPNTFALIDSASGSAILNFHGDQAKSIAMTCQKSIPRPPLAGDRIESLSLPTTTGASVSARLYHDSSAKDGTPIDAVIFAHPTSKLDVFIAGYGAAFNTLVTTIQVIL